MDACNQVGKNGGFVLYNIYIEECFQVCLDCQLDDCAPYSSQCPLHGRRSGVRDDCTNQKYVQAIPMPEELVSMGVSGLTCVRRIGLRSIKCTYYDECHRLVRLGQPVACESLGVVNVGGTDIVV